MSNAGQIAFTVVGGVVGAYVGGPMGAVRGAAVGYAIGSAIFPSTSEQGSPSPGSLQLQTSQYGRTIPVSWGTRKYAGNCIDYQNFQVHEHTSGGKGTMMGGMGGGGQGESTTTYTYTVSLAFGLGMNTNGAAGKRLFRMWKGKNEVDISSMVQDDVITGLWRTANDELRFYDGTQTEPDTHMAQFHTRNSAYKNFCYIVLPNYYLGASSSVDNFTFEIGDNGVVTQSLRYYTKFLTPGTESLGGGDFPPIGVIMKSIFMTDETAAEGLSEYTFDGSTIAHVRGIACGSNPKGICTIDNLIFVCALGDYNVRVINKTTFELITTFGSHGTGNGQFADGPWNIAADDDYVYVNDVTDNRIQLFNRSDYSFHATLVPLPADYDGSYGVAVDASHIYYTMSSSTWPYQDLFTHNISTLAHESTFNYTTLAGQSEMLAVDDDALYIINRDQSKLYIYDKTSHALVHTINLASDSAYEPTGVAVDDYFIYVADRNPYSDGKAMLVYNKTTYTLITTFGTYENPFENPYGIAVA